MAETFNQTEQLVYDTAISEGANDMLARLVLSQLKHESANFTSNVYRNNNNPMGMKMPSKRKSPFIAGKGTQPPGNEGATPYARYNSLQDAVKDLFHFFRFNKYNLSAASNSPTAEGAIQAYAEEMRKHAYMGSTQSAKNIYISGLRKWMNKIAGFTSGSGSVLMLLFLAISITLLYIYFK